jgi:hypothetical protein
MTNIHTEEYWSSRFDITREDLNRAAMRLERAGAPRDLKVIALPIIKGRIEHGHDPSLSAQSELNGSPSIRLWDPAAEWQVGDVVLLADDRFGNSKYESFLGEIVYIDQDLAEIEIDELQRAKTCIRTLPGMKSAQTRGAAETWRNLVSELVEKKLHSGDLDEQAEGILLKYGERILTSLAGALGGDPSFTSLAGKWYPVHSLRHLENESLQAIHHFLVQNQPASLDDILPIINAGPTTDVSLLKMAIQTALQQSPEGFENIGTSARPQWKARLPAHNQAEVIHFAFDPQTFEILCRPGQRLSQRTAHRLQELNLYAHVVTFAGWQMPAHR